MVYVGVVQQIVASQLKAKSQQQPYLSVARSDDSAVFCCFPWAVVDVSGSDVTLSLSEEPWEYYPVVSSSTAKHLVVGEDDSADARLFDRELGTEGADQLLDASGIDADGRTAPVQVLASPILLHSVQVQWGEDGVSPSVQPDVAASIVQAIDKHQASAR